MRAPVTWSPSKATCHGSPGAELLFLKGLLWHICRIYVHQMKDARLAEAICDRMYDAQHGGRSKSGAASWSGLATQPNYDVYLSLIQVGVTGMFSAVPFGRNMIVHQYKASCLHHSIVYSMQVNVGCFQRRILCRPITHIICRFGAQVQVWGLSRDKDSVLGGSARCC